MNVWTGADAKDLRDALRLSHNRFSVRAGIHINTIKKWCTRGETITLLPEYAERLNSVLAAATPAQRAQFHRLQTKRAVAPGALELDDDPAIWKSTCEDVTDDLARKDLLVDRREAATTLFGVVVGTYLLEPLERWLRQQRDTATPAPVITGTGTQELDELEHAARLFREWDDKFGGGLRRKAVVGQLSEVNDMVTAATSPATRQRLGHIRALLAETAATMSWDSGDQHTAQGYYMLSIRSAREAGDPALFANGLAGLARQMLTLEPEGDGVDRIAYTHARANDALELVRLAQDVVGRSITPTTRALLYTREAWAYAKLGRPAAFHRAADNAHAAFAKARPDDDPYWLHYFDAAELSGTLGGRLLELARKEADFADEAAEAITSAIALRRPERWRSSALDRLGIAEARLIQGEYGEARRLGEVAIQDVGKTSSHRVQAKVSEVYQRAAECGDSRPVVELRDMLHPLTLSPA
ncbi:hypothetical protein [Nocardia ignorata]|uniref:HTH cro/C1-type domain-containing protein n=1 Tax=Nocardia ignorata TaxID=145285 RepID=A0A4R6P0Q2_NOCIG|nr:hypothetical protein [Nocardia ignorata]TDP29852.1 hypothetical protein DFR75_112121 [Nocardia ignorata]